MVANENRIGQAWSVVVGNVKYTTSFGYALWS